MKLAGVTIESEWRADLQWTIMGPSCPNCSLVLCTWPMSSMNPSPLLGTPWSGQSVNWNCRTVRHWPSCTYTSSSAALIHFHFTTVHAYIIQSSVPRRADRTGLTAAVSHSPQSTDCCHHTRLLQQNCDQTYNSSLKCTRSYLTPPWPGSELRTLPSPSWTYSPLMQRKKAVSERRKEGCGKAEWLSYSYKLVKCCLSVCLSGC